MNNKISLFWENGLYFGVGLFAIWIHSFWQWQPKWDGDKRSKQIDFGFVSFERFNYDFYASAILKKGKFNSWEY